MIDLHRIAGKRYRLERDPAHAAERRRGDDPWLLIIPCKHGHLYAHGAELIGVATNGRRIGLKIAALGADVWQDGDDGMNLVFPVAMFPKVAAIMRPRRRRQLTPEQRVAASERLAQHRIRPAAQSDSAA